MTDREKALRRAVAEHAKHTIVPLVRPGEPVDDQSCPQLWIMLRRCWPTERAEQS